MHKLNDRKIEEKICYEGLYSELQIVSSVYLVNHVDSDSYCSKHYDRNRELFAVLRRKYLIHYRRYKYICALCNLGRICFVLRILYSQKEHIFEFKNKSE